MKNFYKLINIMEENDFSIEMLNQLKNIFLKENWEATDFRKFSKMFFKKTKKSGIKLTNEMIKQILTILYFEDVINLKDTLFIDNACFATQDKKTDNWLLNEKYKMDFYGPSEKYRRTDFFYTPYFFYHNIYNTKKLNRNVENYVEQLLEEIGEIFVEYYDNMSFPLIPLFLHDYAISYSEDELINGLNNKTPFNVSVIAGVEGQSEVIKLDINLDKK